MVVDQVVPTASENKPRVKGSDVLSALIALLSDQLTCNRCATSTNQAQSPPVPPPAGQEPNHNVLLTTVDNTVPVSLISNSELDPTPANNSGELMRCLLRDIKHMKATIIRQGAAHGDGAKRHQVNVKELRQRKKDRPRSPRSVSDDDYEYRLSKRHDTSRPRFLTTTRDYRVSGYAKAKRDDRTVDTDRTERPGRPERLYSLHPLTTRRSSRRSKSVDDDFDGGRWRTSASRSIESVTRRSRFDAGDAC